jgi:hypothetical protein
MEACRLRLYRPISSSLFSLYSAGVAYGHFIDPDMNELQTDILISSSSALRPPLCCLKRGIAPLFRTKATSSQIPQL